MISNLKSDQIWIQADNDRMTILYPNHEEQTIDFEQIYNKVNNKPLQFSTFDLIDLENLTTDPTTVFHSYPCRADSCDQLCRDETQNIFDGEIINHVNGRKLGYICSCSRDYTQRKDYQELCYKTPQCHHSKVMCDLEVINDPNMTV